MTSTKEHLNLSENKALVSLTLWHNQLSDMHEFITLMKNKNMHLFPQSQDAGFNNSFTFQNNSVKCSKWMAGTGTKM